VEECGPCPVSASFTLAFALQMMKKHGKTSVRVRKISVRLIKSSVYTIHITKTPTHYKTHTNTHIVLRSQVLSIHDVGTRFIRNVVTQHIPLVRDAQLRKPQNLIISSVSSVDRDSSVSIVTGYGLDGPGIESRWGAGFSAPVQTGPGTHPTSCTMGTGSFPGVKSGRGVTLPSHPLLVPLVMKE
jgi:hypothetical protein